MRYALLIFVLVFGCSDRDEAWEPRDLLDKVDSSFSSPDARINFDCRDELIQEDIYHCGKCNNECDLYKADRCYGGTCSCGTQNQCSDGERCVNGQCYSPDPGETCETDSECPSFRRNCINGSCKTVNCGEFETVCPENYACIEDQCTAVEFVPEVCDGIDNDGDGEVDSTNGTPLAEFCYSGPDINNIKPPCSKGIRICENGEWSECMNEVPPVEEMGFLGCDGLDNNCDGCVDGNLVDNMCVSAEPKAYDVVYVIDMSGSISRTIDSVIAATEDFSEKFKDNPSFKFAFVTIPGKDDDPKPDKIMDLEAFSSFVIKLNFFFSNNDGGSKEASWDAIYELATGEIPMNWTPGSTRIIILFTDEEGQSFRSERMLDSVNEQIMCNSLKNGEVVAVVTKDLYKKDFDDCALTFDLSDDSATIVSQLDTIIANPCR